MVSTHMRSVQHGLQRRSQHFWRQAVSTSTEAGVVVNASDEHVWTVGAVGAMGSGESWVAADLVCEHVQVLRWLGNIADRRQT